MNRRKFLAKSLKIVGAAAVVPSIVRPDVLGLSGKASANERIFTGHVGLGGRGRANLKPFARDQALVLCDVDARHLQLALKEIPKGREVRTCKDYRKLLEDKDVDAVVISTPDHWHALPTIHAVQAGKHVYCEKPLTLTIVEGREMVKAARAAKRIVQTGSQQRSSKEFRRAAEIVRSGHIGDIKEVLVGIPGVNYVGPPVPDAAPPPELDYDFWLGPAPWRAYNEKRVHYQFRFFWDYSGGQQTNWGAHHLDIAQWGLGKDESGPIEVGGTAKYHPEGWYEVPQSYELVYVYEGGALIRCGSSQPGGTTFIGTKGKLHVNRGTLETQPAEILKIPEDDCKVKLPRSPGHFEDWQESIRTGKLPICDVEIGHRSATACHLGNIALRLRRKVRWDPAKEAVLGDQEASAMTCKAYRAPWAMGS